MNQIKNILIFAGLGILAYFLIIRSMEFSPEVVDILYTRGAMIYMVLTFTALGVVTLRVSERVNLRYMQPSRERRQFSTINAVLGIFYLALNYGMCVTAKALAGVNYNSLWNYCILPQKQKLRSFTLSPSSFFVRSCTIAHYAASPLQRNILGDRAESHHSRFIEHT